MGLAWADGRRTRPARNVENWGVGLVPPPLHTDALKLSVRPITTCPGRPIDIVALEGGFV